jgi:hypothetical protein
MAQTRRMEMQNERAELQMRRGFRPAMGPGGPASPVRHMHTHAYSRLAILNNRFSEQVSLPIVRKNVSLAKRQF